MSDKRSSSQKRRARLFRAQNGRCYWCHCEMTKRAGFENSATLDHVLPIARGGSNRLTNLVAARWMCNQRRGHDLGAPKNPKKHVARAPMIHGGPALKYAEWLQRRRQTICEVFTPLIDLHGLRQIVPIIGPLLHDKGHTPLAEAITVQQLNSLGDAFRRHGVAA